MFDIQVSKTDLLNALHCVESTVGDNKSGMGDDCISIRDLGDNSIEIYTTNTIEFSRVKLILSSGSMKTVEQMPYVNFKRFEAMIDSIPDGEYISIKSNVNDIEINYGARKKPLKLTGSSNGMVSLPTFTSNNKMIIDKKIIEKGLKYACKIIKDDVNNLLTNCIRINSTGFNVEITAIDINNNRMFLYNDKSVNSNSGDVVIEANKFKKAFKLFENFLDIKFESNANMIKVTGIDEINSGMIREVEYYSRKLSGNYPNNISSMFNGVTEYATVNKDELKSSLIRINAIDDDTVNPGETELNINRNVVNILKTSQYGVVEDSFNLENEISDPIIDRFKTKPLLEILKNFADNGTYGTANTFKIGKLINVNNANPYYILKESDSSDISFLITGLNNSSQQNNP